MKTLAQQVDDVASAEATNATSTATLPAAGDGFKWLVSGFGASFAGAAVATPVAATVTIGAETLKAGVTTNGDGWHVQLADPIPSEENGQPSIALAAGGAGAVGHVYIMAVKLPADFVA